MARSGFDSKWDGLFGGKASPEPADGVPTLEEAVHAEHEEVIPIAEEVARVEKREAVTGRVRVRTHVDVVQEPVRASLEEETVEVTRVPINREITQAPEVRTENGVTIVPVVEEVLVVEKRLVLKEELHIRRHVRTEDVEVPVELRKERVEVERIPLDDVESGTRQVEAGRVPPEDVKSGKKQVEVERVPLDDTSTNPQRVKR
jgi:stress response protein YsnF